MARPPGCSDLRDAHRRLPYASSPRVETYGAPSQEEPDAVIERFGLGETSVVHDGDRIAVLLDISALALPPLCQFGGVKTSTDGHQLNYEAFELVGIEKLQVVHGPIIVQVCRFKDYAPPARE